MSGAPVGCMIIVIVSGVACAIAVVVAAYQSRGGGTDRPFLRTFKSMVHHRSRGVMEDDYRRERMGGKGCFRNGERRVKSVVVVIYKGKRGGL